MRKVRFFPSSSARNFKMMRVVENEAIFWMSGKPAKKDLTSPK